jgi:hypothetical protein
MSSSRIRSSDVLPVRRWRLSSVTILVLAVWIVGTFVLSALQPLGVMGDVFRDTFLPAEIILSLIVSFRLIYRLNRSVQGMPPLEFSTQHPDTAKTSPIASATVLVGFQGVVPTGGNLQVVVRVGGNHLQLVEVKSLRPSYPSYEIPASEIASTRQVGKLTVIKLLSGAEIKLANYRGESLADVLSGAVPLVDATDKFVHPESVDDLPDKAGAHVTNFLFVFGCVVLLLVAILVTHRQWPYALGALVGMLGVFGLIWSNRHSIADAGKARGKRSPAGLRVVVAINLALAALLVFLSYLLNTSAVTVFIFAMATLIVGLSLFTIFISAQRSRRVDPRIPSDG